MDIKRYIRDFFAVFLLLSVICLCACGDSGKKQFVGTWVTTGQYDDNVTADYMTFYKFYSEDPVYAFKRQA
jgi:hypothetical protein